MSDPRIAGINVPLNITIHAATARSQEERSAMIWLSNYARLQRLTAEALAEQLGMPQSDIQLALTSPRVDLGRFVKVVNALRNQVNAALVRLHPTKGYKLVKKVFRFASETCAPCEVIGKWRSGKTRPAREAWFDHMHEAAWLNTPSGNDQQDFFSALAESLGIGVGTSYKSSQLRPRITSCFHAAGIRLLVIDEAQRLWPTVQQRKGRMAYPRRLEFIRDLYDAFTPAQIGVVLLLTPQHSEMMSQALREHELWAPGQWDGRVHSFAIPETFTDAELEGIARWHGPDLADSAITPLIEFAKSSEGYVGAMVNIITRSRYFQKSGHEITAGNILGAIKDSTEAKRVR